MEVNDDLLVNVSVPGKFRSQIISPQVWRWAVGLKELRARAGLPDR